MNSLLLIFLSLGFGVPTPAEAQQIVPVVFSTSTAEDIIDAYAAKYGISATPLFNTLECESSLNPDRVGDFGTSYGIAQIHLPAHPDISKEEALDPFFAINFAAQNFAEGNQDMWTCAKQLGYAK